MGECAHFLPPSSCAHSCQPRDRIQVRALLSQEMRTHRSLLVPSLLGALSLVHCQSEGHPLVNWLLPDIDVYTEMQPLAELQEKLDDFKTEFSDEEAIYRGECYDTMKKRLTLMIENGIRYGFWGNTTIRTRYGEPFTLYELIAYAGKPVPSIPLYETSYERVTAIEYNDTYMDVVFATTHASLVDGFYQWTMKCQDSELYFRHHKVARANFNTAKILQKLVPKLDDTTYDDGAETLTEFIGVNNEAATQSFVDDMVAIVQGEAPCSRGHCWWQGLGPGPGPPMP